MELSSKIISDDEMSSDFSPKSSKEFERESLSKTDNIVLRGQVDKSPPCIAHALTTQSGEVCSRRASSSKLLSVQCLHFRCGILKP